MIMKALKRVSYDMELLEKNLFTIGSLYIEDWNIVTNFITPDNLHKYGDPQITTLASCLSPELLTKYQSITTSTDDNIKVCG